MRSDMEISAEGAQPGSCACVDLLRELHKQPPPDRRLSLSPTANDVVVMDAQGVRARYDHQYQLGGWQQERRSNRRPRTAGDEDPRPSRPLTISQQRRADDTAAPAYRAEFGARKYPDREYWKRQEWEGRFPATSFGFQALSRPSGLPGR